MEGVAELVFGAREAHARTPRAEDGREQSEIHEGCAFVGEHATVGDLVQHLSVGLVAAMGRSETESGNCERKCE